MLELSRRQKVRRLSLPVILSAMTLTPCSPLAVEFRILPSESHLQFKISHLGIGLVGGRFESISGSILMRPADKTVSNIAVSIATTSLNTGIGARDEALLGEDYLRAERFPNITYESTGFKASSSGVIVTGILSLRGVTKTITLVTDSPQLRRGSGGEAQAVLTGRCVVKRKEIGLQFADSRDADETWLGDSVELEFTLALQEVAE